VGTKSEIRTKFNKTSDESIFMIKVQ
jgi:hypothetical protein